MGVKRNKASEGPDELAGTGRDKGGRFVEGHVGMGGRPRRPDLFALAEQYAGPNEIREALWRILKKLLRQAQAGDVQAAKLVLERLTDSDAMKLEGSLTLQVVTGVPDPTP